MAMLESSLCFFAVGSPRFDISRLKAATTFSAFYIPTINLRVETIEQI